VWAPVWTLWGRKPFRASTGNVTLILRSSRQKPIHDTELVIPKGNANNNNNNITIMTIIIIIRRRISKPFRRYLSNISAKHDIK
jgi:hypothetical protein